MVKTVEKSEMNTLPKIVAIDFDGTLVEDKFPYIGDLNKEMFALCKRLKEQGVSLILWSCRDGEQLDQAVLFCKAQGLEFDAVNENIQAVREMFHNDTRKVYADLYIDDKAIPHTMSPTFWAERIGLKFILGSGIHAVRSKHNKSDT